MSKHSFVMIATLCLALWAAAAVAQGDLDVTMRVIDDVSGIEAVILKIGNDSGGAPARERDGGKGVATEVPAERPPPIQLDPANERTPAAEHGIEDRDSGEAPAEAQPPLPAQ